MLPGQLLMGKRQHDCEAWKDASLSGTESNRERKWEAVQRRKTAEIIGLSCHLSALVHITAE